MGSLLRASMIALMLLGPLWPGLGCKRTTTPADQTTGDRRRAAGDEPEPGPTLPEPLPLPADPAFAGYIEHPGDVLATLSSYAVQQSLQPEDTVRRLLMPWSSADLASAVGTSVDPARPWAAAMLEDDIVLHLPVRRSERSKLQALLQPHPTEGEFGAVRLPPPAESDEGPMLAWLDETAATITFARSLRGLATGRELQSAYGEHPLHLTLSADVAERYGAELPFSRATVRGQGLHGFQARLSDVAEDRIPQLSQIAPGAMTGLLGAPQVAWGASTRWAEYRGAVAEIITEVGVRVQQQNFLIRGILEDLARRLNAVLRSWNGRVLLGGGPGDHLLLALGADDPERAERAVLYLAAGVIDNLELASTFGLPVPSLRLRKSVDRVAGEPIHRLVLRNGNDLVPAQARSLLDERRNLNVAMAFPQHSGGAMIVAGPRSAKALRTWMRDTAGSSAKRGKDDLVAATLAIKPETLRRHLEQQQALAALGLDADRKPTRATARREGNDLLITVEGPEA